MTPTGENFRACLIRILQNLQEQSVLNGLDISPSLFLYPSLDRTAGHVTDARRLQVLLIVWLVELIYGER